MMNDALANYRFHEAAQGVYQFFWGDFCDWYIEWVKPELQSADRERASVAWKNLFAAFNAALRLLHPFMPFLTEELWHQLPQLAGAKAIALDRFPEAPPPWRDAEKARLKKEIEGLENAIASKERQLGDQTFRSRAPEKIIKGLEATLAQQKVELDKLRKRLRDLEAGSQAAGTS